MAAPLAPRDPAVEALLASPRLALHLRALTDTLDDERARRARFYDEITEGEKAEFINGEIVMHSPAQLRHTLVLKRLLVPLDAHVRLHDLGLVGQEKMLVSLTRNDYEPDVGFWRREVAATFTPRQMRFPAPDFVAEVLSPSTERVDRTVKLDDYAAHGVAECWLLDPDAETVEQYVLDGDAYALRMKSGSGEVTSAAVEGFVVPVRALFDDTANLTTLRALLGPG